MPPNPSELPVFIELSSLTKQLARDIELERGVEQRFQAYARAWWSDYNTIRPLHQTRLIQLFGLDESRQQKSVCTFVSPLRADRCLDSPLHAARFVRLIPYQKDLQVGGKRTEVFHSIHTILSRRCGDIEDHATLLCSLLLGFGLDAYVAVGTAQERGAHLWVVTRSTSLGGGATVTMWEPLTGQRYALDQTKERAALAQGRNGTNTKSISSPTASSSSSFPFQHLHCLFNHTSFYANNQLEDDCRLLDYTLENPASWKAMNQRALSVLPRRAAIFLKAPIIQERAEERALERKLKELVVQYRREYANLSTSFSSDLSYILSPALASYESERVTGLTYGNEEFQQSIRKVVPENCVFRATPFQFTSLHPSVLFSSLLQSRALLDLLTSDGMDHRFGLRVKVVAYPEDFVAVWVMLASIKKAEDYIGATTESKQQHQ